MSEISKPPLPAEVYEAGDAKLSRRVSQSFKSEMDPEVLRQKAINHIMTAIGQLPDSVRMTAGDMPVPEDFSWLVAVIIRSFSPERLLTFSVAELTDLIMALMRKMDLDDVRKDVVTGPLMMVAGSMLSVGHIAMSPLERTLAFGLARSMAYLVPAAAMLFQQDSRLPSGKIPFAWRLSLANSVRHLKGKNVTIDRYWANMRAKVKAADAAAALKGPAPAPALPPGLEVFLDPESPVQEPPPSLPEGRE